MSREALFAARGWWNPMFVGDCSWWWTTHESFRWVITHPSDVCGHCPHLSYWNNQGCGPHLRFAGSSPPSVSPLLNTIDWDETCFCGLTHHSTFNLPQIWDDSEGEKATTILFHHLNVGDDLLVLFVSQVDHWWWNPSRNDAPILHGQVIIFELSWNWVVPQELDGSYGKPWKTLLKYGYFFWASPCEETSILDADFIPENS